MAKQQKRKQKRTKNTDKRQYKVINWPEYNQALVNRGNCGRKLKSAARGTWFSAIEMCSVG